jgi:hypothetical protein
VEAREAVKHYLSLNGVKIRTISAFATWLTLWSRDTPFWSSFVKRISEGLRKGWHPGMNESPAPR